MPFPRLPDRTRIWLVAAALAAGAPLPAADDCAGVYGAGPRRLVVATGIPDIGEHGLVKAWAEAFPSAPSWRRSTPVSCRRVTTAPPSVATS